MWDWDIVTVLIAPAIAAAACLTMGAVVLVSEYRHRH